jgi:hypothetical protein
MTGAAADFRPITCQGSARVEIAGPVTVYGGSANMGPRLVRGTVEAWPKGDPARVAGE